MMVTSLSHIEGMLVSQSPLQIAQVLNHWFGVWMFKVGFNGTVNCVGGSTKS